MSAYLGAFDRVLFFGREYDEVLEMLALTEEDLRGKRILDCPSGPDAFVADASARGFDVTGCDPMYAQALEEIIPQGRRDIQVGWDAGKRDTSGLGGLDLVAFHERKLRALDRFAADFETGKREGRYRVASLPELPFPDQTFDLVISANFLFSYSSAETGGLITDTRFNLDFHLRSVRELIRVCSGEIRLYPILTVEADQQLHPYAAQIIGILAADGVRLNFAETPYNQGNISGKLVLKIDCSNQPPTKSHLPDRNLDNAA